MSEEYGNDIISIVDEDGNEFNLELLDTMDYNGESYGAFLPTDIDEDDPDFGLIILQIVVDEDNNELFDSIDDDEKLQDVYEHFKVLLFDDEEEEEEE